MSLDLAPETEAIVREHAEQRGVTIDELLTRAFPPVRNEVDRVMALLHQWQREYGLPPNPGGKPDASISELFDQWREEDARRTPAEIEANQRLWESLKNEWHGVEI